MLDINVNDESYTHPSTSPPPPPKGGTTTLKVGGGSMHWKVGGQYSKTLTFEKEGCMTPSSYCGTAHAPTPFAATSIHWSIFGICYHNNYEIFQIAYMIWLHDIV